MSRQAAALVYAAIILVGFALAAYGRFRPDHVARLGELLEVAFASRALRIALVVFWWWLGWHFLVGPTII